MDLSGAELGSKQVVADIEAGAWEIEPSTPGTDGNLQASPADFKKLAAIEANDRALQFTVADIDERRQRIPGKRLMLINVLNLHEIGSEPRREKVGHAVYDSVVAVSIKKK